MLKVSLCGLRGCICSWQKDHCRENFWSKLLNILLSYLILYVTLLLLLALPIGKMSRTELTLHFLLLLSSATAKSREYSWKTPVFQHPEDYRMREKINWGEWCVVHTVGNHLWVNTDRRMSNNLIMTLSSLARQPFMVGISITDVQVKRIKMFGRNRIGEL